MRTTTLISFLQLSGALASVSHPCIYYPFHNHMQTRGFTSMTLFNPLRRWSGASSKKCYVTFSLPACHCYGEFSAYRVFQTRPSYGVSQTSLPSGASEASPGRVTYKHSLCVVEPASLSVKWWVLETVSLYSLYSVHTALMSIHLVSGGYLP